MSDNATTTKPAKLEDQIREACRVRHYSLATDPTAEPVPGSLEQRLVPDGVAEHQHTSGHRVTST